MENSKIKNLKIMGKTTSIISGGFILMGFGYVGKAVISEVMGVNPMPVIENCMYCLMVATLFYGLTAIIDAIYKNRTHSNSYFKLANYSNPAPFCNQKIETDIELEDAAKHLKLTNYSNPVSFKK